MHRFLAALLVLLITTVGLEASKPRQIRVLVWDEQQPEQRQAYSNYLGNAIADYLRKQAGLSVKSVSLSSRDQGLDARTLDHTDVVIWWGHVRHQAVDTRRVDDLVKGVLAGRLSLVALHSAHFSQPFMKLMNERARSDALAQVPAAERGKIKLEVVTSKIRIPQKDTPLTPSVSREGNVLRLTLPLCVFPSWRADGKPSHVRVRLPKHPLARGLPAKFDIPHTEMYDEPFHVPPPDAIVFEETWDRGEKFKSGLVWKVGKGRVVYFRPGHETYPVYRQAEPLRILENAVRWLAAEASRK
jgi:trehalose utilization protein